MGIDSLALPAEVVQEAIMKFAKSLNPALPQTHTWQLEIDELVVRSIQISDELVLPLGDGF